MIEIPLPHESQLLPLVGQPGWTPAHEVKYLCWLARQVPGDILEIGCNNGQTTLELATACPDKTIYACDWTGEPTMDLAQRGEQPPPERLCELARHLPHVRVFNSPSADLAYERLDLGLIFIDGDHSYDGVRLDTEKALRYFAAHPAGERGTRYILWHDCYPEAPHWCGVWRYLGGLVASTGWALRRVQGTWLARLAL